MRLGGRIFRAERHFHINYKSICIIYGLPITVKVTDLALNVPRSLIHSFHMHYIFFVKVFNELMAHLESLARSLARSPSLRRFGDNQEAAHGECWDGKSEGSCTRLQWRPGVFSQCISLALFMSPTSADNSLKSSPPLPQNTIVTTSGKRNVAEESNQNQKKAKPKTPLTQVHQELSTFHFRIKCFWSSSYGWLNKNNPTPSHLENASKFLNKKQKYAQNKMSIPKKN